MLFVLGLLAFAIKLYPIKIAQSFDYHTTSAAAVGTEKTTNTPAYSNGNSNSKNSCASTSDRKHINRNHGRNGKRNQD